MKWPRTAPPPASAIPNPRWPLSTAEPRSIFGVILGPMKAFPRITVDPQQMGGLPCIRGLRIPVARVVSMIAEGISHQQILADYPDLEEEDIREALAAFP